MKDYAFYDVTLTLNAYMHVVGTYDGSSMILYVNGSPVASAQDTRVAGPLSVNAYIGSYGFAATSDTGPFDGTLDEVALYNVPLSQQQVAAHYSAGAGECFSCDGTSSRRRRRPTRGCVEAPPSLRDLPLVGLTSELPNELGALCKPGRSERVPLRQESA